MLHGQLRSPSSASGGVASASQAALLPLYSCRPAAPMPNEAATASAHCFRERRAVAGALAAASEAALPALPVALLKPPRGKPYSFKSLVSCLEARMAARSQNSLRGGFASRRRGGKAHVN